MLEAPKCLYLDEAQSFLYGDDTLEREIRAVDGVPSFRYLVNGERIFVFKALKEAVSATKAQYPERTVAQLVETVLDKAWMPIETAVSDWGVVPNRFKLVSTDSGVKIIFTPFKAAIPGVFADSDAASVALCRILRGESVPGSGDFHYRGQAFLLEESLDPEMLPEEPRYLPIGTSLLGRREVQARVSGLYTCYLKDASYCGGFSPITRESFQNLRSIAQHWHRRVHAMRFLVASSAPAVEEIVANQDFTDMYEQGEIYALSDYELSDLAELRSFFPECAALPDSIFYDFFATYQQDCVGYRGVSPCHDQDFCFYLLGRLHTGEKKDSRVISAGYYAAHLVQQGAPPELVRAECSKILCYQKKLDQMCSLTDEILRYLNSPGDKDVKVGPEVISIYEIMQQSMMGA